MDSIFHRISVRRYEDKHVEKEKLMQILRAGMLMWRSTYSRRMENFMW